MDKYYDKLLELEYYFVTPEHRKEPTPIDIMRLESQIGIKKLFFHRWFDRNSAIAEGLSFSTKRSANAYRSY